jgi:hypothetical protein
MNAASPSLRIVVLLERDLKFVEACQGVCTVERTRHGEACRWCQCARPGSEGRTLQRYEMPLQDGAAQSQSPSLMRRLCV